MRGPCGHNCAHATSQSEQPPPDRPHWRPGALFETAVFLSVQHVAQALHCDPGVVEQIPQADQPHQRPEHAAHQRCRERRVTDDIVELDLRRIEQL